MEGLFIFPRLSTARAEEDGKKESSRDPNKPMQSPWYEPGLSEIGYFLLKYGSIISRLLVPKVQQ